MKLHSKIILGVGGAAILLSPFASALALGVNLDAEAHASTSAGKASIGAEVKANAQANRIANAKANADKEIDRRTDALTALNTRIQALVHLSADQKASINTMLQGQISTLATLKTKIDADTATDTLKVDIQSVTKSYRIFALILPQGRIAAAADAVISVGDEMTTLAAKLQARITEAQNAGKDVSALLTSYTEINAKIGDAKTNAQAASSETASLSPDNGDKTVMDANNKALADARAKLKVAAQDLRTARQDIQKILQGLKSFHLGASASTTVSH